ncbi:hypothetical protein ACF0H5_024587 [Mactra antiquata]
MVASQLTGLLKEKWGLTKIETIDQTYDPNLHQAVAFEEGEQYQQEIVIEEFQCGYRLHERIIRAASVKVGKPLAKEDNRQSANDAPPASA